MMKQPDEIWVEWVVKYRKEQLELCSSMPIDRWRRCFMNELIEKSGISLEQIYKPPFLGMC